MAVVRWTRAEALSTRDPMVLDELDAVDVLILEDVSKRDDEALAWCRRAPCVVMAIGDRPAPSLPDIVLSGAEVDRWTERVVRTVEANRRASRVLADVLRVVERLYVIAGLVVESMAYSMLLAGSEFRSWLAAQPQRSHKEFSSPPVRIERQGPKLRITLNRPENRNAFSAELRDALVQALTVAEVDATIEDVVLDAEGPVFSSGGDLSEFGTTTDVARAHQIRTLRSVGAQLERLAVPVTARVQGDCVGAGLELSAFADRVVAEAETTLRLPEVGMGLIPGAGGTVSLSRRLGRQRAGLLALCGQAVAVTDPLVNGFADEIS